MPTGAIQNLNTDKSDKSAPNNTHWGERNTSGVTIASSLNFKNVSHTYGKHQTLKNVSLSINPGEVMCLLGPSGSGKTTLLKMAAGLLLPKSGNVLIDQRIVSGDVEFIPPEKRGVGLVFQDFALFPHLNIIKNVQFGLTALSATERLDHAMRTLDRVGLASSANLYPHNLSGGEQQRVALARALAPRPGILLMDEPFSGLDARLRENVRDETLNLLRDTRSTVLIVTHDPEEALNVSDRIALMQNGQIEQVGTPSEIYSAPVSLFAARFFSELNILDGTLKDEVVDTCLGKVKTNITVKRGNQVVVCVRQSDLVIKAVDTATAQKASHDKNSALGRVIARRFLGNIEIIDVIIENRDEPLKIRIKTGRLPTTASLVTVSIIDNKAMVFEK